MIRSVPDNARLRQLELSRRLAAFASASALAGLPTVAAIIMLIVVHHSEAPVWVLATWGLAALALMAARLGVGFSLRPSADDVSSLERQWTWVNIVLVTSSLGWAISLPLAAALTSGSGHTLFAVIGAVLFSGVLLLHRSAPGAASFHILALGTGLVAAEAIRSGAIAAPLAVVIALYAFTLISSVRIQDRQFRQACQAELIRQDSERTVRMLLSDHEAQGADWLWSIDSDGTLYDVSDPLAGLLGETPDSVEGRSLVSLLEPGIERDRISGLLVARRAFRDEPVTVVVNGQPRAWRLSGHQRADGGMTGVGRDVTERQQIEERVRTMAYVDPLTGLANRHMFNQRLRELLGEDGEAARPAALFYLDLDEFKAVNDQHGHVVGDALLREMGTRLLRESREGDLVARLGGDEFAVLVDSPSGDGIMIERAHRLLAAAREPFHLDGQVANISTSIGFARAGAGCDSVELLRRVDLALYAAKAKGRDQIALFDDALDRRERERRALEQDLREAIGRNEMVLHYQPIIALGTGETIGYEALLRWRHPRRGLLLPDSFLPIAEESGLIMALGDWVIGQALADVVQWGGNFRLALNLSPSQIRSPQLIAAVDGALAAVGFPASRLEFEITEHVLLKDTATGAAMLGRLRELGAQIALDDFGTGYSSLSYLRRFRFDRIKIDRSFVRDIETSAEAQAIVSAITRLAVALGMKTTAEGVERVGQLDLLRKLGCDEAQGFLILRPTEAGGIEHGRRLAQGAPSQGAELAAYRAARTAAGRGAIKRRG